MNVFDLVASLTLDSSQYDESLASAEEKGSGFGSKLKTGLASGAKVAVGAVTALTTATIAGGKALIDATGKVAAQGDAIDKQSQKLGLSATAYQEWDAILQHSGTSISALQPAMKTLQKAVEDGGAAFEALGISQEQVAAMSQEELFSATITALQNVGDETERNTIASDLLGRSYMELQPLLNTSAEDTEAMRQAVHDLGGVMSDEMVLASAAYQDTLQDMQTSVSGLKMSVVGDFLPSVTTVMDGLTMLFSGNPESGIAQITNGVQQFIDQLFNMAPQLIDVGSSLIMNLLKVIIENLPNLVMAGTDLILSLAEGFLDQLPAMVDALFTLFMTISGYILENLPVILEKGMEIVKKLAEGVIKNLPTIIKAIGDILMGIVQFIMEDLPNILQMGLELMFALIEGIIQALPDIVGAIAEVLVSLVTYILEHLPEFITLGIQLMIQLIAGLIQAIPQIIAALPEIFTAIFDAFRNVDWLELGREIIYGIINGLVQVIDSLWDAAVQVAKSALNAIKNVLGISSPSKVFRDQVGKMIPKGLAIGIEANTDEVENAMDDLRDVTMIPFDSPSMNVVKGFGNGGSGMKVIDGLTINVYPREGQDEKAIAEYVMEQLNMSYEQAERALA